ncbi:hypothetical protein ACFL1B_01670 [Nanoarchaeota archaeon]
MGLIEWENKKIKNLDAWDIPLIKLAVFFFTLMLVSFWPVLATWDWYWYLIIGIICAIRPWFKFFK